MAIFKVVNANPSQQRMLHQPQTRNEDWNNNYQANPNLLMQNQMQIISTLNMPPSLYNLLTINYTINFSNIILL